MLSLFIFIFKVVFLFEVQRNGLPSCATARRRETFRIIRRETFIIIRREKFILIRRLNTVIDNYVNRSTFIIYFTTIFWGEVRK